MKLIGFLLDKIKSLHPKNNIAYQNIILVIFLLFFVILELFLEKPFDNKEIVRFTNGGIYTVLYYHNRNNIGPYFSIKHNNIEYKILCYQPKITRKQISEICNKKNVGAKFIGDNVVVYKDTTHYRKRYYAEAIILNANFIEYDCKNSCKSIYIKTPLSDVNKFFNRFKYEYIFMSLIGLFFLGYLILQIKYRFFNYHKGN